MTCMLLGFKSDAIINLKFLNIIRQVQRLNLLQLFGPKSKKPWPVGKGLATLGQPQSTASFE